MRSADSLEYVIGIDIGTSSSKGILATVDGTVIRRAARDHEIAMPRPGWAEHDAESVWWSDVCSLLKTLLPDRANRVIGVCISGIGPCVLITDASGTPMRPAILYGIDTRAASLAKSIEMDLGGTDLVLDRCGSVLSSQSEGPKLSWIRMHDPIAWSNAKRFFTAHSYIVYRLTGQYVLDHHSASQFAPFYDRRSRSWITEWTDEFVPGLPLPSVRWPSEVAGRVTPEGATESGLAPGTSVAVGTFDAMAEAESVDARRVGDLVLMYGSTMCFTGFAGKALLSPTLWSTSGNYPAQYALSAGMASTGSITLWFRKIIGGVAFEDLIREAAESTPGAGGLIGLPYFAGERTPFADPRARGVIAGFTLRHGRGDIYRCLLESTAFAVRHNLTAFHEAGFTAERVIAVGGGTTDALWPQIVTDVTGVGQELPIERSGASFGDTKFAAVAVGAAYPELQWNRIATRIEPSEVTRSLYDRAYENYHLLRKATVDVQHNLSDIDSHQ